MMESRIWNRAARTTLLLALILVTAFAAGCKGDRGSKGKDGTDGEDAQLPLGRADDLPGLNIEILEVNGGKGAGGNFEPGDTISVTFTLTKDDGSPIDIEDLDSGSIIVSGPTFHYQPVIERQRDLEDASVANADGSYTYSFATSIPDAYIPPINDTDSFGPEDGEWQGQPLLSGTYTVGMEAYIFYEIAGLEGSVRDPDNEVAYFLLGDAVTIEPREVVGQENCDACHAELRIHGTFRREVEYCLLCHYTGAEDGNDPEVEGGTPGVTIDMKVMTHKIHNGEHLPSVLGVGTNDNGSRDYDREPVPYIVVGRSAHDYSHVAFPAWPNLSNAMPRDAGYSDLDDEAQDKEDEMRRGVTSCFLCHGDPDGDGPIEAPAQGGLFASQPTRGACGACHDDIDWDLPYSANLSTMPPQTDDASCVFCHPAAGSSIAVTEGHLHPLDNTDISPGLNFDVTAVVEAGAADMDGTFDPGEKISITFTMTSDLGDPVTPDEVNRIRSAIAGPTSNRNMLNDIIIPGDALGAGPEYTINIPEEIDIEFLGTATGGADVLFTARTPIWTAGSMDLNERIGIGNGAAMLAGDTLALQNFLDVDTTGGFARSEWVVVEDGQPGAEYAEITLVDGNRLWISPALASAHVAGVTVTEVVLDEKDDPADYSVTDADNGEITLVAGQFGAGNAVLVAYMTDFVMPVVHQPPMNDSPDLGEDWGDWTDKTLIDGTYTVGLWGRRSVSLTLYDETNSYRDASPPMNTDVLVLSATEIEPAEFISSGENCNRCHVTVLFHGSGRRDFDTCVQCHTSAGEDRPQYVAGNAPATPGATVEIMNMIHAIHMGEHLYDPESYVLVGFGGAPYPNNFTPHTYEEVVFPPTNGGPMVCVACHGEDNTAWMEPSDRDHPTEQGVSVGTWRMACAACHNSPSVAAHIDSNTNASGQEACDVCHGTSDELSIEIVHKSY